MYVPGGMQELIKIHSLKKYIIPSEDEQDPMEMYQSYIWMYRGQKKINLI